MALPRPLFLLLALFLSLSSFSQEKAKPRIIITADPELDDNNSLIRFLLYSSDVTIEGLVYTSSQFHWKGDGKGTLWQVPNREYNRFGQNLCPCESWRWAKDERFIHDAVDAYAKVYPNLRIHNPEYPAPDLLKSKIRYGNIEFDGDISKETPGSDLIRDVIMDDKPGQLFITAWGGHSSIARALKSIQEKYGNTTQWEAVKKKVSRKVVLLPSGDQDNMYELYIRPNWPDIEYRQFSSGPNYSYGAQLRASREDSVYLTPAWMTENVTSRGPLGSIYRVWGDGKQMVKGDKMDYFGMDGYTDAQLRQMGYIVWMPVQPKGSWLGEGDNHTVMNMLGNGLRAWENGFYGGWGGRSEKQARSMSFASADTSQQGMVNALTNMSGAKSLFPNFFPAAQRDFAARMKWSVTPRYAGANHEPMIKVNGPLAIVAYPGQKLQLAASLSDPDGNAVSVRWWQFQTPEHTALLEIANANTPRSDITIPKDAVKGTNFHVIIEATDNGTPALTRYQRIIITIGER